MSNQNSFGPTTSAELHSKRISFCLPTKNRAAHLEKALESFRALKSPEDEFILVDGGSEDNTIEVAKKFSDLIDIFISEPDVNGMEALNKAFFLSRGKYIKYLADDDRYYRDGLDKAVEVMDQNPEIDLLLCGGVKEWKGKTWNYIVPKGMNFGSRPEDLFRFKGASGVGHFIRTSSLARLGILYPSNTNADTAFALEFINKGGNVRFCRIKSFHHVIYDHSAVIKYPKAYKKDNKILAKKYCSKLFYYRYILAIGMKPLFNKAKFVFNTIKKYLYQSRKPENESLWDGSLS